MAYGIHIIMILVVLHRSLADSKVQELCDAETFDGQCDSGQAMVMKSARYGRMKLGRCVKVDMGHLGCSSDVLSLFDSWCSGRKSCDVFISNSNEELVGHKTCIAELMSYVELEYACVNVAELSASACRQSRKAVVTGEHTVLSSYVTEETGCGNLAAPWVITTSPGHRIRLSMTDFGSDRATDSDTTRCPPYGYISEPSSGINETLCGGMARERHVYESLSSNVIIQFLTSEQRELKNAFIVRYEVVGCPDMKPPKHSWYKRNGNSAVIGCDWSEHSWHLNCEGNNWVGVVGNCSGEQVITKEASPTSWSLSPLLSVSLIIGLGVLVVVLFCVALIGCVCIISNKRRQYHEQPVEFQPPEMQQAFLYHPGRPVPVTQSRQDRLKVGESGEGNILQLTKPTTTDELIHIWETPLPIPKQVQSSIEVGDNSTTKSGRSTLPVPPHVCKDGSTMSRSDYSTDTYWAGTDRYFDNDLGWVTMPPKA